MPPRDLSDIRLTIDPSANAWRPCETENEPDYVAVTEYSRSGRAKCRRCSSNIAKGVARVGFPIPERRGEFGIITAWQHPECSRIPGYSQARLKHFLHGLEQLTKEDKRRVLTELTKEEAAPLDEIKPEDEEFFKRKADVNPIQPPESITKGLLPFQEEGLGWMVSQEHGDHKGGILADEMGMGKTIQTIAMIVQRKEETPDQEHGPTLIVCPTSAMPQWADEIFSFTKQGTLSVATYYGDRSQFDAKSLRQYDIVVTTYPVLEREWRSVAEQLKHPCKYCGKKYMPKALEVHNTYFCGPEAARSARQNMREKKSAPKQVSQAPETMAKGMSTLGIGTKEQRQEAKDRQKGKKSSVPTPMAVYNEIMVEAGREPKAMGEKGSKREARESFGQEEVPEEGNEGKAQTGNGGDEQSLKDSKQEESEQERKVKARKQHSSRKHENEGDNEKEAGASAGSKKGGKVKKASDNGPRKQSGGKNHKKQEGGKSQESIGNAAGKKRKQDETPGDYVTCEEVNQDQRKTRRTRSSQSLNESDIQKRQKELINEGDSTDQEEGEDVITIDDSDDEDFVARKGDTNANDATANNDAASDDGNEENGNGSDEEGLEDDDVIIINNEGPQSSKKGSRTSASKSKSTPTNTTPAREASTSATRDAGTPRTSEVGSVANENDEEVLDTEEYLDMAQSSLHAVEWFRIILDEAHKIKARNNNSAKSVYALRGSHKWCLTGTPLQNRVGELYSLIRFLKLDPFAYYFCKNKNCECKSLKWNFGKNQRRCVKCGHPAPQHYSYFNNAIMNPINRYGGVGDGKKAFIKLKEDIMDKLQLRRTKKEREKDMELPPLDIKVKKVKLSEEERDFYESIYKLSSSKFDTFVEKGTVLHNYAHIFELLSRLRQAVDHPFLIIHKDDEGNNIKAPAKREEPAYYCGLCQEEVEIESIAVSGCNHTFHKNCIMEYTTMVVEQATCPVCKVSLSIDMQPQDLSNVPKHVQQQRKREEEEVLPSKSILSRLNLSQYQPSAKIEALVQSLREMREQNPDGKAIVFSQYTNMIDLTEWRIKKEGIHVVKLLGSMPLQQRRAVLQSFRSDPSVACILLSLKAGGEGLNLQAASHVMVLEPWWNPAVEMQAIQRAHRIGQDKHVQALRFCVEDTIEEKMLELQEKKQLVFDGCVDGSATSLAQLTTDDLAFLFKR